MDRLTRPALVLCLLLLGSALPAAAGDFGIYGTYWETHDLGETAGGGIRWAFGDKVFRFERGAPTSRTFRRTSTSCSTRATSKPDNSRWKPSCPRQRFHLRLSPTHLQFGRLALTRMMCPRKIVTRPVREAMGERHGDVSKIPATRPQSLMADGGIYEYEPLAATARADEALKRGALDADALASYWPPPVAAAGISSSHDHWIQPSAISFWVSMPKRTASLGSGFVGFSGELS